MQCLNENAVQQLAQGQLDAAARVEIGAHLETCADCRKLVSWAAQLLSSGVDVQEGRADAAQAAQLRSGAATPGTSDADAPGSTGGALDDGEVLALVESNHYELRREIARGGMGAVFEAWDRRHGRRVAIKLLLHDDDANARRRFMREARIGARLQHPGIVPVYEAGRFPAGAPFLAMKLVEGRSLEALLGERSNPGSRLALLPNLIAAVDAVAYAHSQGVLHRDLKPANVLIGQYGETVVIDWGLAKTSSGSAGEVGPPQEGDGQATGPTPSDGAALTNAGATLGTPSYMPPEQARGEPVDARADVYALGAIIYALLAGGAPYLGSNSRQVVRMVRSGPPPPLSSRAPGAPAELVAIVERAMQRRLELRYPSAGELAEDLRRFASGRLVSAHSYSTGLLVRRWISRHRAAVSVGAVALLVLSALALLAVRRIAQERRTAVIQRDAAEGLSRFMVVELRKQLNEAGRVDLLGGVAAKVDEYYRAVSALEDANGPEALARRAEALETLADVEVARHDQGAARQRLQEAIEIRGRAAQLRPADREQRARLIEALLELTDVAGELSDFNGALAASRRAEELTRTLLAEDPKSARAQLLLASCESSLANVLADHGDVSAALEARRSHRDLLARMSTSDPGNAPLQANLADALIVLGQLELTTGHVDDARSSESQARALVEHLMERDPGNADWWRRQAQSIQMLAAADMLQSKLDSAVQLFQRCEAIATQLLAQDPSNSRYQGQLGQCLGGQVESNIRRKRPQDAKPLAEHLLALRQRTANAHPEESTGQRAVLISFKTLADISLLMGEPGPAADWIRRGLALLDDLEKREPGRANWLWLRGGLQIRSAKAAMQSRLLDPALESARSAVTAGERMAATGPNNLQALELLGAARAVLGEVLLARGELAGARAAVESSCADFDSLWQRDDDHTAWLEHGPAAARTFAIVVARANDAGAARARLVATLATLKKLDAEGKLPAKNREELEQVQRDLQQLSGERGQRTP